MESKQALSVKLLYEILATANGSRIYAEYKLKYLSSNNPNTIKEITEFEAMQQKAEFKISQIEGCIAWLNSLEVGVQS